MPDAFVCIMAVVVVTSRPSAGDRWVDNYYLFLSRLLTI